MADPAAKPARLMAALTAQGVPATRVMGVDAKGVPIVCGTDGAPWPAAFAPDNAATALLPDGLRGWEAIPCVVRRNGLDTFRLEVNANSIVTAVTLTVGYDIIPESGGTVQNLRDDGLGGDRVAGDRIWTSVLMRADPNGFMPANYGWDTNSPPGLFFTDIGTVNVVELTGETNEFLILPMIGLMDPRIPLTTALTVSSNVQVTPHLVNIRGTTQASQQFLRHASYDLATVTGAMYDAVPDAFDFLIFFTTDHLEQLPRLSTVNFVAGVHTSAKVNYSGTGLFPYDNSAYWGGAGRLLGVNVLDAGDRGTYVNNATHELVHQWSSFTDTSLGLSDGTGHYTYLSGAASLVGGAQFIPTNGGYLINCHEARGGAHHAPPLDKYMMGWIDGAAVPPTPVSSGPSPFTFCDQVLSNANIATIVTIGQIQQVEGVRTPGPSTAQRDFTIGFAIESNGRLLNATELTFYEILARYYTQPWPAAKPDPYVEFGWVPIGRFFGEGTTWHSYVLSFVQPRITSLAPVPGARVAIGVSGFPRASYNLEGSTNLTAWHTLATLRTGTNGLVQYTNAAAAPAQFYRAAWNE